MIFLLRAQASVMVALPAYPSSLPAVGTRTMVVSFAYANDDLEDDGDWAFLGTLLVRVQML